MGEGIYKLPSNMNLNIRSGTAGCNNEILVSNGTFSLGRNDTVNASAPEKSSHKTPIVHAPVPRAVHTSASEVHKEEMGALVLILTWNMVSFFFYVYSDHSILECYNSMRSFFVISLMRGTRPGDPNRT